MPSKGDSALHRKMSHRLNLFRPPWTCGRCERKVYLWCMHYEGCGFCLTTVECPMRGHIPPNEDAWLYRKWKTAPVDETKPLVVGYWLSNKDILAWLNDKPYHNEVEEPRA